MAIGNPITLTNNVASKIISVTATADQTLFTVTGGYRINQLAVFRNGVRLVSGSDFTANDGASVTLLTAANLNDTIEFQVFDTFRVDEAIHANEASQTINGNLTLTGDLTATTLSGAFSGNATGLTGTPSITVGNVVGAAATFTGNISVGGTSPQANLDIAPASSSATLRVHARTDSSPVPAIELVRGATSSFGTDTRQDFRLKNSAGELIVEYGQSGTTTEAIRIDSVGRFGIGESSPGDKLTVGSTSDSSTAIRIQTTTTGNGEIKFGDSGSGTAGYIRYAHDGNHLIFARDNTEVARFSSGGNFGINNSSPSSYDSSARNLVVGSGSGNQGMTIAAGTSSSSGINFADGTTGTAAYTGRILYQHSANALTLHTNGGLERCRIDSSGRFGIGNSTMSSFTGNSSDNLVVGSGSGGEGITVYSATNNQGSITFADGTSGDAAYRGAVEYNHTNDNLAFRTAGTGNRMVIDSSGDLGLGVSPNNVGSMRTLHIKGPSGEGAAIRLQDNGDTADSDDYQIYKNSSAAYLRVNGTDPLIAYLNGSERLRIASAGQIGLGGANYGTSGQVITSNGSGSAPTWQDAAGGSWNLITTVNASGASQADVTGTSSSYNQYCIIGRNVRGSGATDWIFSRWFNNGTLMTGSNYNVAWYTITSNSPGSMSSNSETNYFRPGRIGSGTNDRTDFILWFNATHEDNTNTFNFQFSGQSSIGSASRFQNGGGAVNTSFTNISGVRFYPGSGTITGTFQLYGIS